MALSVVWFVLVLTSLAFTNGQNNGTNSTEEMLTVRLTVFDEINKPYSRMGSYVTDIQHGMNAYDVMVKIEQENPGEFSFLSTEFPGLGYYITAINGLSENIDERLFWGFYIFNRFSDVGVSSYYPKDGDHIIWKYMTYLSVNVTVINTLDNRRELGTYKLDYVNRGTSLYQVMVKLEETTDQEFNFVTSTYARLGHYVEAIDNIWADVEDKLFWGISNNDEFLDVGVDSFFPEHGDHIKFEYMAYHSDDDVTGDDADNSSANIMGYNIIIYLAIMLLAFL